VELLITPAQVAKIAFRAPDFITDDAVSEATIVAATQKFIRPVFGDALVDALVGGSYTDLLTEYIQPPLALYVKLLMLPVLAVQTGSAGVVEAGTNNLFPVGEFKTKAVLRRLRGDAAALTLRAVLHVEEDPLRYPEYDPSDNILHRLSTDGGVVLTKSN
jgi:hypothetical protein